MPDKKNTIILKIFLSCYVLAIVNSIIFKLVNEAFFYSNLTNPIETRPKYEQFILGVLLAPILETWLFQFLPNRLFIRLKIYNQFLLILLPAVLFGAMHVEYSLLYGICMLIFGLILNYFFLRAKDLSKHYFWLTVLLHMFYNMPGILI